MDNATTTTKVIAGGIVAGVLIVGGIAFAPEDVINNVPPIEYVLDNPDPDAGNVRANLELLTAGGLYKDRKIKVTVTKRTAKENREVLKEFNVEIVKDVEVLDSIDKEKTFEKNTK